MWPYGFGFITKQFHKTSQIIWLWVHNQAINHRTSQPSQYVTRRLLTLLAYFVFLWLQPGVLCVPTNQSGRLLLLQTGWSWSYALRFQLRTVKAGRSPVRQVEQAGRHQLVTYVIMVTGSIGMVNLLKHETWMDHIPGFCSQVTGTSKPWGIFHGGMQWWKPSRPTRIQWPCDLWSSDCSGVAKGQPWPCSFVW